MQCSYCCREATKIVILYYHDQTHGPDGPSVKPADFYLCDEEHTEKWLYGEARTSGYGGWNGKEVMRVEKS